MNMEEERLRYFQEAITQAEVDYQKDNTDAEALTRWGGGLLEIAHLYQGKKACETVDLAIEKLQYAVQLDGSRHNALWCLGNAYTSKGFLAEGKESADPLFTEALKCFKKAQAEEPENDIYRRAVEVTLRAPEIYEEIQRHMSQAKADAAAGLGESGVGASTSASARETPGRRRAASNDSSVSDVWWDAAGWVCLIAITTVVLVCSPRGAA